MSKPCDARIWSNVKPVARRYGWHCAVCGATGKNFLTGASAKKAATKHNGGVYR